ncbi:MAG TPA: hypothetical protein VFU08_06965 [Candidatus Udaeobacter sp.]|nr:hypothetical protein [Candidatus Udaeobacter sp.]
MKRASRHRKWSQTINNSARPVALLETNNLRQWTFDLVTIKFLVLVSVIGLASTCVVQAQTAVPAELPAESPSSAKKHRQHKMAEATASPAETAASPTTAESPTASPRAIRPRKKAKMEATPSPSATPTASPRFRVGDLFKPKSSVSASPSAAPVTGSSTGTATPAPSGGRGLVWVNTETHVYHKEGSRFYGTTKKGKYVSEADAIKEGDRPAAKGQ